MTVDIPKPYPKAGEVLIKVRDCTITNTEIWMREGAYGTGEKSGWRPEGVPFPRIPGSDITGEVVELGDGVDQMVRIDTNLFFLWRERSEEGDGCP